jgi:hypothetical protein
MLVGEAVDVIPFTVYSIMISTCQAERELRNDGLCIVNPRPPYYTVDTPNCRQTTTSTTVNGTAKEHIGIETPAGILQAVQQGRGPGHHPTVEKHLFADADDYEPLAAYLQDMTYHENFEEARRIERQGGGDIFMRGALGYSPLQHIVYRCMGVERFSFEWADNRSRILELYDILSEKYRQLAHLAARSPLLAVNICGNVTASVISPNLFEKYYLPRYGEAIDILHSAGKLAGVHFDGITAPYADLIASSDLDYIEALTPPPTCDVTVAQAHAFWPDKALWINFPSSLHLATAERIAAATRQILDEARPHKRFLVGITEDVPHDRWPVSFRVILDTINEHPL